MNTQLPRLQTYRDRPSKLGYAQHFYRLVKKSGMSKVAHGCYVANFDSLTPREQHRVRVAALATRGIKDLVLVGRSAASWWGVWLPVEPKTVELMRTAPGQGNGKLFRRKSCLVTQPDVIDSGNGIKVLAPIETVISLIFTLNDAWSLTVMDWLLRYLVMEEHLREDDARLKIKRVIEKLGAASKRARALCLLEHASCLSMSAGESLSRYQIIEAGFEAPILQRVFRDKDGFVAQTDFYFELSGVAGEFDGMIKYKKPEYLNGRDPADVVIAEKRREDRLRKLVKTVVRWTWRDLQQPGRLAQILREAGVQPAPRNIQPPQPPTK